MGAESWPAVAELTRWINASKVSSDFEEGVILDKGGDKAKNPDRVLERWVRLSLLGQDVYRYEFFAAMQMLTQVRLRDLRDRAGEHDYDNLAGDPPVLFRAHQSLSFPTSEIFDLRAFPNRAARALEMTVTFIGLTGAMGALPRYFTEKVMDRTASQDYVLRDFLDLFNHRLISLFNEAGQKYRFWFAYEKSVQIGRVRKRQGTQKFRGFELEERPNIDHVSQNLLDLAGFGTPLVRYKDIVRSALANRTSHVDETFRFYAGLLSNSHRSVLGLEQVLSCFFDAKVTVQQFVGQWLHLPAEYRTCLPVRVEAPIPGETRKAPPPKQAVGPATALPRLGQNTVVGSRIWEAQGKFRIRLGPLTYHEFIDYLPGGNILPTQNKDHLPPGRAFRKLAQLARVYVRGDFDYDVQPTLHGHEVPWCQLGGSATPGPRLGLNTWIRNEPFREPVDDAVFQVDNKVSFGS
jgi:type VI secretion system protein ImpH